MQATDLSNANLSNAWMSNANLTNANLFSATMKSACLTYATLTNAKMIRTDLSEASLTSSKMNGVDLTEANLTNTSMSYSNLTDANCSFAKMAHAKLVRADLTHAKMIKVNLCQASLIFANINDVDLSAAEMRETNLSHANLTETNLSLADLTEANLTEANLTGVNLQLIHSLEQSNIDLSHVILPLLDTLSKAPFSQNQQINQFVDKLIVSYLDVHALRLLSKLDAHPTIINSFLHYFDQQPHLLPSDELNSAFIQTILAARTQDMNTTSMVIAHSLYEKYLNLAEIPQQLQYDEIKGIFGDYAGNADWSDKHAANYLLLSPTKPGRTLIFSENILNNMLHPDWDTKWDNIVLFRDGKCLSQAEYNLTQCYQQEFPLFSIPFKEGHYQASLHKLIETLDLGEHFKPLFLDALHSKSHSTKLVDDIVQQELNKIFSRVIDAQEYQLKEQNYDQIIILFNLSSSTNREKAEYLFSLATVFSRYTSKVFFGTEDNSPIILRYYAYALMEKAHQIDPTLLSDMFDAWKKQLLGIGVENNSTCSDILSDDMTIYARQHCNETFKKIIHLAWR